MPEISDQDLQRINKALERAVESEKRNQQFMSALGPAIVKMLQPTLDNVANSLQNVGNRITEAVSNMQVNINPEVKIPPIEVPTPEVTVNIPEQKQPKVTVSVPTKALTNEIRAVKKAISEQKPVDKLDIAIPEYTHGKPMPVMIMDVLGKPWEPLAGASRAVANMLKSEGGLIAGFGEGSQNNALRVVHASDFATSVNISSFTSTVSAYLIDGDGNYRGTVPIEAGTSLTTKQLSGAADSVNVTQLGGNTIATNAGVTGDGTLRVVHASDVGVSAKITSSDTSFEVKQVSGSTDSINLRLIGGNTPALGTSEVSDGFLRVVQAADFVQSVKVVGFTSTASVVGSVASDVADDAEGPIKVGGIARTANPTAVAAGDRVSASFDDLGRQVITPLQVRDLRATAYATLTNGTETTLLAAGGAGVFHDLVMVMAANTSGAAAQVDFRSVTGGNVEFTIEVPSGGTGGVAIPMPWPQGNANNNWTVDMGDITGTTIYISALFSKEV